MNMRPTDEQPDGHKHPDLDDVLSQIDEMESQWRQQDDADGMVESDRVIGGHFAKVASIDSQAHNLEVDSEASSSNSTMSPAVSSETLDSDPNRTNEPGTKSLVISTMLSLFAVLVLLGTVRLLLPEMLEWCRYSWARGQLRAEYEVAGQQLRQVSVNGLSQVSQLVGQRVSPSVIHINMRQDFPNESLRELHSRLGGLDGFRVDQGSGIVIDDQGHVVTNYHVIEGGGDIEVYLSDGRLVEAEVVGVDDRTDLAVLKIDADSLLPMVWGDSDQVSVGMPVWAVGSPFGLTGSVTFGILSGKHRIDLTTSRLKENVKGKPEYSDLMQSDVAINPGNSGGPLVNEKGEVIGINTAIIGDSFRGVSFAIPSNVVRRVCEKIIATGKMERGRLGIYMDRNYHPKRDGEGVIGVRIIGFDQPSTGQDAGLQIGDILVEVDGRKVEDLSDVVRYVGEAYVGSEIKVVVNRDGQEYSFSVRLAPEPMRENVLR